MDGNKAARRIACAVLDFLWVGIIDQYFHEVTFAIVGVLMMNWCRTAAWF